jgi:two-component system chemotaxis response regulator CheY
MKILLIDDSKTIHTYIKGLFDSGKNNFEDAFDGQEGVDKLKSSGPFDLILLDWEMPKLNGIETLKAIREFDTETPIVMVTTKNNPDLIAEAFEYGADEYVMKPFTKDILHEKLSMILSKEVA